MSDGASLSLGQHHHHRHATVTDLGTLPRASMFLAARLFLATRCRGLLRCATKDEEGVSLVHVNDPAWSFPAQTDLKPLNLGDSAPEPADSALSVRFTADDSESD